MIEPTTATLLGFAGGGALGLLAVAVRWWWDRQVLEARQRRDVGRALRATALALRPTYRGSDTPFRDAYLRTVLDTTVLARGISVRAPVA